MIGRGNRPGDIEQDTEALSAVREIRSRILAELEAGSSR